MKKEYNYILLKKDGTEQQNKASSYKELKRMLKDEYALDQTIKVKDLWTYEGKTKTYTHQDYQKIFRLAVEEYYKDIKKEESSK